MATQQCAVTDGALQTRESASLWVMQQAGLATLQAVTSACSHQYRPSHGPFVTPLIRPFAEACGTFAIITCAVCAGSLRRMWVLLSRRLRKCSGMPQHPARGAIKLYL